MVEQRKIPPDATVWYSRGVIDFYVCPDDLTISGFLTNALLALVGNDSRMRLILYEDAIRARGIMTIEQSQQVAFRMELGPNGNFHDPNRKTGIKGALQTWGLKK